MSASGIIFAMLTSAAYALMATGHSGWSWVMIAISWPFLFAATYHDNKNEKRIAALEKKLYEMRNGGG